MGNAPTSVHAICANRHDRRWRTGDLNDRARPAGNISARSVKSSGALRKAPGGLQKVFAQVHDALGELLSVAAPIRDALGKLWRVAAQMHGAPGEPQKVVGEMRDARAHA